MIISIINLTSGKISDAELQRVIRAINRQIAEDFAPYWSFGGSLRLEGRTGSKPDKQHLSEMRGDAVIYLWDKTDVEDALGYHEKNYRGIPYGLVFSELSKQLKEPWSVTLSHEALELIGDPQVNLLVQGTHPDNPKATVFHWFEMCDAVQGDAYEIDEVAVSNFVLPLYFTGGEESGGRNDFLGSLHKGKTLRSFGINPGGYIGFYDPATQDNDTYARKGDKLAAQRLQIKGLAAGGRTSMRKGTLGQAPKSAEKKRR